MSEVLATSPALPEEAATIEGRLADIMEDAEISVLTNIGYPIPTARRSFMRCGQRSPCARSWTSARTISTSASAAALRTTTPQRKAISSPWCVARSMGQRNRTHLSRLR